MKYSLLFVCILLFACNHDETDKVNKIRVTGEGKIRAKPNLVMLTLSVSFTQPKMVDAVRMTQETVDSVVNILARFGSRENDIKTSSISANKAYTYNGKVDVFSGFQAEQSIEFVLNDINKFTELTGKLLGTKISSISQIQFGHSKTDSLFREADLLAYDDALKSANKLCDRAHVKLGELTFVSNTGSGNSGNGAGYSSNQEIETYSKAYGGRGFKISPEVMEFKRNIVSEYVIEH